jgi:hypothetical protein
LIVDTWTIGNGTWGAAISGAAVDWYLIRNTGVLTVLDLGRLFELHSVSSVQGFSAWGEFRRHEVSAAEQQAAREIESFCVQGCRKWDLASGDRTSCHNLVAARKWIRSNKIQL